MPERVGDQNDVLLAIAEIAADRGRHAERRKEPGGDVGGRKPCGLSDARQRDLVLVERSQPLEGMIVGKEIQVVVLDHPERRAERTRRRSAGEHQQPVRLGKWQGPQQHAVQYGKNCTVGADSQSQRHSLRLSEGQFCPDRRWKTGVRIRTEVHFVQTKPA